MSSRFANDLTDVGGRGVYTGADGSTRLLVYPGEGEWVCAACDTIAVSESRPRSCSACGSDRIETLTSIKPCRGPDA